MKNLIKGVRKKTYKRFWYVENRIRKGLRITKKSLKFYNKYKNKIQIKHKPKKEAVITIKPISFIIKGDYGEENNYFDFEISINSKNIKDIEAVKKIISKVFDKAVSLGYTPFKELKDKQDYEIGINENEKATLDNEVKIRGVKHKGLTKYLNDLLGG